MLKKSTILLSLIVAFFSSFIISTPSFAEMDCSGIKDTKSYEDCMAIEGNYDSSQQGSGATNATFDGGCRSILGLTSWDCGVNISNEDTLKTGIWQIAANVSINITIIAAYLVLGYVIYGGYQYIFSAGDPNKVTSGKKTLSHAFIGLAIVMAAFIIMSSIRIALLGANNQFSDCVHNECVNPNSLVTNAVQWVIGIAGAVAAIFIVYGGIAYTTSAGDPNKLTKAKQIILYALIGMAIVALAEIITAFVSGMIRDAGGTPTSYHQIINPKEHHEIHIS
ncbi:hypothetical protein IKF30_00885 [Candidatus Saccharibacteria bacterium]|nr:hypothetical protein [Candidatus Saccharibacteria bacterium]